MGTGFVFWASRQAAAAMMHRVVIAQREPNAMHKAVVFECGHRLRLRLSCCWLHVTPCSTLQLHVCEQTSKEREGRYVS